MTASAKALPLHTALTGFPTMFEESLSEAAPTTDSLVRGARSLWPSRPFPALPAVNKAPSSVHTTVLDQPPSAPATLGTPPPPPPPSAPPSVKETRRGVKSFGKSQGALWWYSFDPQQYSSPCSDIAKELHTPHATFTILVLVPMVFEVVLILVLVPMVFEVVLVLVRSSTMSPPLSFPLSFLFAPFVSSAAFVSSSLSGSSSASPILRREEMGKERGKEMGRKTLLSFTPAPIPSCPWPLTPVVYLERGREGGGERGREGGNEMKHGDCRRLQAVAAGESKKRGREEERKRGRINNIRRECGSYLLIQRIP